MQPYASTGGVVRSGPHNLLNDADDSLPARGPITVRPIAAEDYIFGLGMFNVGGDDTLRLSFYTAGGDLITSVVSAAAFGFFGIVDDTGAAYATVDFVGGNGYAPTDDWQAATRTTFLPEPPIAPVPLPAGLPLLAAGLGAIGALRLRRQANSLPGPKSS